MNIGLRHLRAFVAVADKGSFTAAANHLHVVPSALTTTIQQLENGCGLKLLERSTRKLRLTPAGKAFLPKARSLIEDFTQALEDLGSQVQLEKGHVTVAAFASVISGYLPIPLRAFRGSHPAVTLSILEQGADDILQSVRDGIADIGITNLPLAPVDDLTCLPCCSDAFGILCRVDHPLTRLKRSVRWKDLADHPYIGLTSGTGIHALLTKFAARIQPPPSGLNVSSITALQTLVAEGFGISVLPRLATLPHKNSDLVFLQPAGPVITRDIYIVYRRDRHLSPAPARFLEILRRYSGQA